VTTNKVENIKVVHEKLNSFIDSLKVNMSPEQ
jgi:hypothetical protein